MSGPFVAEFSFLLDSGKDGIEVEGWSPRNSCYSLCKCAPSSNPGLGVCILSSIDPFTPILISAVEVRHLA